MSDNKAILNCQLQRREAMWYSPEGMSKSKSQDRAEITTIRALEYQFALQTSWQVWVFISEALSQLSDTIGFFVKAVTKLPSSSSSLVTCQTQSFPFPCSVVSYLSLRCLNWHPAVLRDREYYKPWNILHLIWQISPAPVGVQMLWLSSPVKMLGTYFHLLVSIS